MIRTNSGGVLRHRMRRAADRAIPAMGRPRKTSLTPADRGLSAGTPPVTFGLPKFPRSPCANPRSGAPIALLLFRENRGPARPSQGAKGETEKPPLHVSEPCTNPH